MYHTEAYDPTGRVRKGRRNHDRIRLRRALWCNLCKLWQTEKSSRLSLHLRKSGVPRFLFSGHGDVVGSFPVHFWVVDPRLRPPRPGSSQPPHLCPTLVSPPTLFVPLWVVSAGGPCRTRLGAFFWDPTHPRECRTNLCPEGVNRTDNRSRLRLGT